MPLHFQRILPVAFVCVTSGCSVALMNKPPAGEAPIGRGDCTRSVAAPVIDAAVALGLLTGAQASSLDTEGEIVRGAVIAGTAYSAVRGFLWSRECKRRNALSEQAIRSGLHRRAVASVRRHSASQAFRTPGAWMPSPLLSVDGSRSATRSDRKSRGLGREGLHQIQSGEASRETHWRGWRTDHVGRRHGSHLRSPSPVPVGAEGGASSVTRSPSKQARKRSSPRLDRTLTSGGVR